MKLEAWAQFLSHLASLLELGFTPAEAVEQLYRRNSTDALLGRLRDQLERGLALGAALSAEASLPAFAARALAHSQDNLPATLARLALAVEGQVTQRRQLDAMLAYPRGVAVAILVIGWVLFGALGNQLCLASPVSTRMIWLASRVTAVLVHPAVIAALAAFALFVWLTLSRVPWLDAVLLRVPFLGPWLSRRETVNWLKWLSLELEAGLPLEEAAGLATQTCTSPAFRRATEEALERMRAGSTLGQALERHRYFFPLAVWLVGRAEAREFPSGSLDRAASCLSLSLELDEERGVRLVEPLALLLLGCMVGGFVVVFLLPIFSVAGAM